MLEICSGITADVGLVATPCLMRIYVFSFNASDGGLLQHHDIIQQSPAWLRFRQRGLRGERRGKMLSSKNLKTSSVSMRPTKRSSLPHQSAARERPLVGKQPQTSRPHPERTTELEGHKLAKELNPHRSSTPKRAWHLVRLHHRPKRPHRVSERAVLLGEAADVPLRSPEYLLHYRHQHRQLHRSQGSVKTPLSPISQRELSTDPLHRPQSRWKLRKCL